MGAELRRLREQAGFKIEDVARRLYCSRAKISNLERGKGKIAPRDVRDMCDFYGVPEQERSRLIQTVEIQHTNWWQPYRTDLYNQSIYSLFDLEVASSRLRMFENSFVSGLLQIEGYTRALFVASVPDEPEIERERRLRLRMARQQLVYRDDPPQIWVILDEAVLRRPVGTTKVMNAQLSHLATLSELHHVTIQVIPFSIGAHIGMSGPFWILDFADNADPATVFVEGAAGPFFLEQPEGVHGYNKRFDQLLEVALPPKKSADFIRKVKGELT